MNDDRPFESAVDDWLEAGSDQTPRAVVEAVLLAIQSTPQGRDRWIPWRIPTLSMPLPFVAAIAIIAVAGAVGLNGLRPGTGPAVTEPEPSPIHTGTPEPSPTPSPTPDLPHSSMWPEYTSSQFGFAVAHPPDWAVVPATRAWTYEADGDGDELPSTPGADHFDGPGGDIRMSAWAVPIDPKTIPDWSVLPWSYIVSWVEDHCAKIVGGSCDGISERAIPMCLERADCHEAAVLVPGASEVEAYVLDYDSARMKIVTVWGHDLDPAASLYGGARGLLEQVLQSMNVWPGPSGSPSPT